MGHQAKNSWGWGWAEWVSLVLHVVQCALKPPYDFVPDKHYCVNINWIFCKYQPGFVNTNTNLQMPALKTLQQLVSANYWMCVVWRRARGLENWLLEQQRVQRDAPNNSCIDILTHFYQHMVIWLRSCEYSPERITRRTKLSKKSRQRVVKMVAWPWSYLVFLCLMKVTCHHMNIVFFLNISPVVIVNMKVEYTGLKFIHWEPWNVWSEVSCML